MAGLGPPPMLDCSVPMWWKSICLIMQPSPPRQSSVCPTETFALWLLPRFYCVCLALSLFTARHLPPNIGPAETSHWELRVTGGGQCELEPQACAPQPQVCAPQPQACAPQPQACLGGATVPVPRKGLLFCSLHGESRSSTPADRSRRSQQGENMWEQKKLFKRGKQ